MPAFFNSPCVPLTRLCRGSDIAQGTILFSLDIGYPVSVRDFLVPEDIISRPDEGFFSVVMFLPEKGVTCLSKT
jgi:hypothetical protein